jgi:hypothetical protein
MDVHFHARFNVAFFMAAIFLAAILSALAMSVPLTILPAARTWKDAAGRSEQGDSAD